MRGQSKHTHRSNQTGGGKTTRGKKCKRQLRKQARFSFHHSSEMSVDRSKCSWAVITEIKTSQTRKWRGKEPNSALTSPTSFFPSSVETQFLTSVKSVSLLSNRLVSWVWSCDQRCSDTGLSQQSRERGRIHNNWNWEKKGPGQKSQFVSFIDGFHRSFMSWTERQKMMAHLCYTSGMSGQTG